MAFAAPSDFDTIGKIFRERLGEEVIVLSASPNNGIGGIDATGKKLANKVGLTSNDSTNEAVNLQLYKTKIIDLAQRSSSLKFISMIGHSLGGLFLRNAIGYLEEAGFFHSCKPVVSTLFSKWLSSRRSHNSPLLLELHILSYTTRGKPPSTTGRV